MSGIAELVARFPLPRNPLSPAPHRPKIKIGVLQERVDAAVAALEVIRLEGAVGSTKYFTAEAEYNRLSTELKSKRAVRAEIARLRKGEAQTRALQAQKIEEVRALERELKVLEGRGERETSAAYRLTNQVQELAYAIKCCDDLVDGGNKYDNNMERVLGFQGERERLEKHKADSGDLD